MKNKRKYPSRQVRRAIARRKAKHLDPKEPEQNGNQDDSDTQDSDKPKRKWGWKSIKDVISLLLKAFEVIRDTF